MTEGRLPLEGVRVIEMGRLIAAPSCAQVLGDLGADVIKVERPVVGDDVRGYGPPFLPAGMPEGGASAFFLAYNRNKRSICIDFGKPEGAELLRALTARSDVFIENYKVGSLDKYGLDEASIRKVCEDIIYLSVSGFGQGGPYANCPSTDVILQGLTGLMNVTGEPDRPPMKVGVSVVDMTTGLYGAIGIIAALFQRAQGKGKGGWVGVSLLESSMALMASHVAWKGISGEIPGRIGNSATGSAPSGVFQCRGGEILVQAGKDADFQKLCRILNLPDVAKDPRFEKRSNRVQNEAALLPILREAMAPWDRDEFYTTLVETGVICGPVNDVGQTVVDPQVASTGIVTSAHHPDNPDLSLVGNAVRFGKEDKPTILRHPPRMGEHTAEVLSEVLGMTTAQIGDLAGKGVIDLGRDQA